MSLLNVIKSTYQQQRIPLQRQIYVNRSLRLDKITMIGFDMDHTLAVYHLDAIDKLAYDMTVQMMIEQYGYPSQLKDYPFQRNMAIRGLVVDKPNGNLLKMDEHGFIGKVMHGHKMIRKHTRKKIYKNEKISLPDDSYHSIDCLFAIPEVSLYANLVQFIDDNKFKKYSYEDVYRQTRASIDCVHREGTMKKIITSDLPSYIARDSELANILHRFRSSNKKLFLLTNSNFSYTDKVMDYLLSGVLRGYPHWKNYFNYIVVNAQKPDFFIEDNSFEYLDADGENQGLPVVPSPKTRFLKGGNLNEFEEMAGIGSDNILYMGDHIYGDILRSKKSSLWRTAQIIPELEREIRIMSHNVETFQRLCRLDEKRFRLDQELVYNQMLASSLTELYDNCDQEEDQKRCLRAIEELHKELSQQRKKLHDTVKKINQTEVEFEKYFNPYWGMLFKEGAEKSWLGKQVEAYACVYTSRFANFQFYSPLQFFRAPRGKMPHE